MLGIRKQDNNMYIVFGVHNRIPLLARLSGTTLLDQGGTVKSVQDWFNEKAKHAEN